MLSMINKRNRVKSKKGFSLSEMLLVVGLMAFVGAAAIGGIAVVTRIRERMEKEATANMIMLATVSYLRADLNDCENPQTMDCNKSNGAVYYTFSERYSLVTAWSRGNYNKGKNAEVLFMRNSPQAKYYNSNSGIMVCVECNDYTFVSGKDFATNYSYLPGKNPKKTNFQYTYPIAENVMQLALYDNPGVTYQVTTTMNTGMISVIGGDPEGDGSDYGKIIYDDENKLFKFWVFIVDSDWKYNSNKTIQQNIDSGVILTQYVEVCPDPLMPTTIP